MDWAKLGTTLGFGQYAAQSSAGPKRGRGITELADYTKSSNKLWGLATRIAGEYISQIAASRTRGFTIYLLRLLHSREDR